MTGRASRASVRYVDLNISTQYQDDYAVVSATGEIDLHTAPRLQSELATLLRTGTGRLVIDLGRVEFCDSTGVNVLLAALRRAKDQGGSMCLVSPQAAVRKILRITGLDNVFPLYETLEEAMGTAPATEP